MLNKTYPAISDSEAQLARCREALLEIANWTFKGDDALAVKEFARAALAESDIPPEKTKQKKEATHERRL